MGKGKEQGQGGGGGGGEGKRCYTVIRGECYDVTSFLAEHPGGEMMIRQGVGRDATSLFESYHVRDNVVMTALSKLPKLPAVPKEIPVEKGPFPNDSKFYRELKEKIRKEVLHGGPQRGNMAPYILSSAVAILFGYAWFIYANTFLSAVFLGFIGAHIGMTWNHCANHGGLFRSSRWNYLFGLSDDLIGVSSLVWSYHHHVSHHIYCNDVEKDQDVFTGLPFIRFDRRQPARWYNRFQHLYIGLLFPFLFVTKHVSDYKALFTGRTKAVEMIGATPTDYLVAHLGKIFHFSTVLFLPMYLHGPSAIWMYLVHGFVGSIVLAWLFAISHNLEDTKEDTDHKDCKDWAVGQVEHSANYGGMVASILTGGLNLQIEHHLFPAMAYRHYPAIAGITRALCRAHKVRYTSFATLPPIIASFVSYMRNVGSERVLPQKKAKKTN